MEFIQYLRVVREFELSRVWSGVWMWNGRIIIRIYPVYVVATDVLHLLYNIIYSCTAVNKLAYTHYNYTYILYKIFGGSGSSTHIWCRAILLYGHWFSISFYIQRIGNWATRNIYKFIIHGEKRNWIWIGIQIVKL